MTDSRFDQTTTLSFDCYGTLIDWESGIWDALQPLLTGSDNTVTRKDALFAFAQRESQVQAEHPDWHYPAILRRVHQLLATDLDRPTTSELDTAFGQSVAHWPAFPDTATALRRLGRRYALVILSNIDHTSFAASNRKLGVTFDAVYTAQDIGSYKPDPANFTYLLDRLDSEAGTKATQLLHVAQSLYHDHEPAARLGLASAWIDRQNLAGDGDWGATRPTTEIPPVTHRFPDLASFAAACT